MPHQSFAWLTVGDDDVCPICEALSGQVEDIETWGQLGLPPIHIGCRCDLVAVDEFEEAEAVTVRLNEYLEDIDFQELDGFDQADALREAARRVGAGDFD